MATPFRKLRSQLSRLRRPVGFCRQAFLRRSLLWPRAQDERKALIDHLLDQGHLRRIDPVRDSMVRVSLRPTFYLMDVPTRTKYADAIYKYYFDGSNIKDTVILRDGRHGNEIGRYNPYGDGLSMSK